MCNTLLTRRENKSNVNNSDIDDYILERVNFRAKCLAIKFGMSDERRDDYAQEMVVEVLTALEKHDPSQSNCKTFVNRVLDMFVKNAVRTIINRRKRACSNPISLNKVAEGFHPVVNDTRLGELSEVDQVGMKMDFDEILSKMPQHLQRICKLLKEYSVSETANKLGINRTAIYRHIAEIREHFLGTGYEISGFGATDLM